MPLFFSHKIHFIKVSVPSIEVNGVQECLTIFSDIDITKNGDTIIDIGDRCKFHGSLHMQ